MRKEKVIFAFDADLTIIIELVEGTLEELKKQVVKVINEITGLSYNVRHFIFDDSCNNKLNVFRKKDNCLVCTARYQD